MMFVIFGYFGPETVMPVTSIIATVAAFIMMFGKAALRMVLGWICLLKRPQSQVQKSSPGPHFPVRQTGDADADGRATDAARDHAGARHD